MNFWALHKKPQDSLRQQIERAIFNFVNVDTQQRKLLMRIVIGINYSLSYLIVFFLIMQSLASQFVNLQHQHLASNLLLQNSVTRLQTATVSNNFFQAITIILLIRLFLALIYIFTQKVHFIIINKLLLIVNIFLTECESTTQDFIAIQLPLFLVQVTMIAVWAYKIERRITHFDSRLHCRFPFIKEMTVYFMALIIRRVQKMTFSTILINQSSMLDKSVRMTLFELQAFIVIALGLGMIILADLSDFLYNSRFKRILLSMDGSLVILLMSWLVLHVILGQIFSFYHYLTLMLIMIFLTILGLTRKQSYQKLYDTNGRNLQYQSESQLLYYFETLRKLTHFDNMNKVEANLEMIKFIQFHRQSCLFTVCPLTQRFNVRDSVEAKSQLIEEYMIKQLQRLISSKPVLKKYLIYYLSPKDKVYRYLKQSNNLKKSHIFKSNKQQYVKRELFRLAIQKKNRTNQIKMLQAQTIRNQILSIIQQYLISAKRFYSELIKDRINSENVVMYGKKMLNCIEEIQKLKQTNSQNFTQGPRLLINNFTSRLVQYPIIQLLQTVVDPPFLIQKTTQTFPTFIISAQPQNFLSFIDANIACTKQFYVSREVFMKLTVLDLLPQQIKVRHLAYFNKVVKKIQFDGVKNFPRSLFVFNKLGFATFFRGDIYSFYSIKGRIWCVSIEIFYKMKAIVLIGKQGNGKILGISQLAIFHGFNIKDKGKQLSEQFFASLLTKNQGSILKYKRVVVQAYDKLFQNDDFHFLETKSMQIIEQNTAFGFTYYLVEVKSVQDCYGKANSRTSFSQTLVSKDLKTNFSTSEQQANFVPKHQFHYHSDGVVRLWEEQPDDILANFSEYLPSSQNQEVQLGGELGKDIVEMRLVNNQLDFLQNIEQEQQFMSKPMTKLQKKQNEIINFNLNTDFFKQCLKNRLQQLPKWLYFTRIIFTIVTIIFLFGLTFIYVHNTIIISNIDTQSQIISSLSDNQLKLIELSKILLGYKFYMSDYLRNLTIKDYILKITTKYEQNSKFLNYKDQAIANYFSGGQLQIALSRYSIAFNNISSNASILNQIDQQQILKEITQKILPAYYIINSQKLSQFLLSLSTSIKIKTILIILMDILTVTIWIWTIFVYRSIQKIRRNLLKVISKIPDRYFDKQLIKLLLFEQYIHFDKDIYCEDDLEYILKIRKQISLEKYQGNQKDDNGRQVKKKITYKRKKTLSEKEIDSINSETNHLLVSQKKINMNEKNMQDQNPYLKEIIYPKSINKTTLFAFLWTVLIILLNSLFFRQIQAYSSFSQEIIQLQQNLHSFQSTTDTVWLLLNKFPYNRTEIETYSFRMYASQSDFKIGLRDINRKGGFDQNFINATSTLWSSDCCKFLKNITPNCDTQLKGALSQGANQITAYLYRKYDLLIYQQRTPNNFHSSSESLILSNLQLHYFAEIKSINQKLIFQQHQLLRDKYERVFFAYFIVIILCFAVIGIIYKLIARENQSLIKVEQFFKLIEFESLKNVKEFKLFIKETYYDKFFK